MKTQGFINCCTAKVVYDFGTHEGNFYNNWNNCGGANKAYTPTVQEIKTYLINQGNLRTTVCITNNTQKNANKALQELGFQHSKWMRGRLHDTKIRLWWKEANA